jgi:lipoate-protein ligase A
VKCCDLTLGTSEENLACDEVLLDLCEGGSLEGILRFWEPSRYFVVVGYANHVATEVNRDFCQRHDIPILRRCTGGGAVLQGPGCLNYSLFLPISSSAALGAIAGTNNYVLERHQRALQLLLHAPVEKSGHTDLSVGGLKFCGNAQRRKKLFLLFHGSFLLNADIGLIEKALPLPSHQPEYRAGRSHADFLVNLKVPAQMLKLALAKSWEADQVLATLPLDQIAGLASQKYAQESWNFKF